MATWADWLPDILPHVQGCPSFTAEDELRRSAQMFFEGTRAWQVLLDPVHVAAGVNAVLLAPDDEAQEIVRIESALLDGCALSFHSAQEMDSIFDDDWSLRVGTPTAILMIGPSTAQLYPAPLVASVTGLKCRVSVRPSESSTGIPDEYWRKYREQIASGAKARLMSYAEKSWTNPDLAMMYGTQFSSAIAAANLGAAKAFGRGRIPSRPSFC